MHHEYVPACLGEHTARLPCGEQAAATSAFADARRTCPAKHGITWGASLNVKMFPDLFRARVPMLYWGLIEHEPVQLLSHAKRIPTESVDCLHHCFPGTTPVWAALLQAMLEVIV